MFSLPFAIYMSVLITLQLQRCPVGFLDFTVATSFSVWTFISTGGETWNSNPWKAWFVLSSEKGNCSLTADCYMLGTTKRLPFATVVKFRASINQHWLIFQVLHYARSLKFSPAFTETDLFLHYQNQIISKE